MNQKVNKAVFLLAAFVLLFALGKHSYGFYILLRWIVCGMAVYGFVEVRKIEGAFQWIFGSMALVFNPIIPVHFDRKTWQIVDFFCAILFIYYGLKSIKTKKMN